MVEPSYPTSTEPSSKATGSVDDGKGVSPCGGVAGIRIIGVTTGGWSRQELLDAGCIEVYKDVAELLERFDQSALTHYGPSS
jgi:hypothetical protein